MPSITQNSVVGRGYQHLSARGAPYVRSPFRHLSKYHFGEGSWDCESADKRADGLGALRGTIQALHWLRECGLKDHAILRASLGFWAATQGTERSFSETRIKLAHSPQPRFNACASADRCFFTDAVPSHCLRLGTHSIKSLPQPVRHRLRLAVQFRLHRSQRVGQHSNHGGVLL